MAMLMCARSEGGTQKLIALRSAAHVCVTGRCAFTFVDIQRRSGIHRSLLKGRSSASRARVARRSKPPRSEMDTNGHGSATKMHGHAKASAQMCCCPFPRKASCVSPRHLFLGEMNGIEKKEHRPDPSFAIPDVRSKRVGQDTK